MNAVLVVLSAASLLASAWLMAVCDREGRRHFPPQFADGLSARYFAQYLLLYPMIPSKVRRLYVVSSAFGMSAFAGFAAVAYRAGNPVIAAALLLICSLGAANLLWQCRRARR